MDSRFLLALIVITSNVVAGSVVNDPIKPAVEDEVTDLPGLNDPINFRQYSGYLKGDNDTGYIKEYVHYWFFESQSEPATDPVVLWLNGGPGCSSMGGLFTELGPFTINSNLSLELNEYSWNKKANLLFFDSPTGVGFSYPSEWESYTDDSTAAINHQALKSFISKFPQYKNNPLYLSGESYAGVYLPTLGNLVDADPDLNLAGIAIGNGYLDTQLLRDSLLLFSYNHGLMGESRWKELSTACCSGKYPSRESCNFDLVSDACQDVVERASSYLYYSGVNPYNIYAKCSNTSEETVSKPGLSRDMVDRAMTRALSTSAGISETEQQSKLFTAHEHLHLSDVPCVDDRILARYLNQKEVQEAIHVTERKIEWKLCTKLVYYMQYPIKAGGLAPQVKSLIDSKRNLSLLVYNGDVDAVCNFLGDEWFVDDLGKKVIASYKPWLVNNQIAGWYKVYEGNLAFATIRGSGHMVPGDKPREAFHMINTLLDMKRNGTKATRFEL